MNSILKAAYAELCKTMPSRNVQRETLFIIHDITSITLKKGGSNRHEKMKEKEKYNNSTPVTPHDIKLMFYPRTLCLEGTVCQFYKILS